MLRLISQKLGSKYRYRVWCDECSGYLLHRYERKPVWTARQNAENAAERHWDRHADKKKGRLFRFDMTNSTPTAIYEPGEKPDPALWKEIWAIPVPHAEIARWMRFNPRGNRPAPPGWEARAAPVSPATPPPPTAARVAYPQYYGGIQP